MFVLIIHFNTTVLININKMKGKIIMMENLINTFLGNLLAIGKIAF